MSDFIDPVLYATTPKTPNMMGMAVTLTEPVDGKLLAEAVESVRERFPYFYVRPKVQKHDLVLVANELPVVVRDIWAPTTMLSVATNYHIMAWKYEGKRLAVEILHIVTDGSGFIPYVKSVLFCYLSKKYGVKFDPKGFRLPGDQIPQSEIGNPFPQDKIDAVDAPFYVKPAFKNFAQIDEPNSSWRAFCIKLSQEEVMRYCGELDASPNALACVMLARAVHRLQPQESKVILGGVAVNQKAILGNYDNYRGFSDLVCVDFQPDKLGKDVSLLCTVARGQIMLQTQPENMLFSLKSMKKGLEALHRIPSVGLKMLAISHAAGRKRTTFTVSYANSRSFGPLDPYIEELYTLAEPASSSVVCEIACINNAFFLHFEQCFESEDLLEAFLGELHEVGISTELMRKEAYLTSTVRYDGVDISLVDKIRSVIRRRR